MLPVSVGVISFSQRHSSKCESVSSHMCEVILSRFTERKLRTYTKKYLIVGFHKKFGLGQGKRKAIKTILNNSMERGVIDVCLRN